MPWMIRSNTETDIDGQPLYWSNERGWEPKEYAGRWTQDERDRYYAEALAMDAVWELVEG